MHVNWINCSSAISSASDRKQHLIFKTGNYHRILLGAVIYSLFCGASVIGAEGDW